MLHAVDDVSFTLEKGCTLGVVGESGCGKTTLGRTILHLTDATDGRILFEGKDITRPSRRELRALREQMQIIFQDPFSSLDPRMTVGEAIKEPLQMRGNVENRHAEKHASLWTQSGLLPVLNIRIRMNSTADAGSASVLRALL